MNLPAEADTSGDTLLSICIPTFNRADQLEDALVAASREVAAAGDEVELVVSDNCSVDGTPQLVSAFDRVRYFRNEQNVGAARNIHRCVKRARGEFVWVLGDDDALLPGSVRRVLQALHQYRPDYLFAAMTWLPASERARLADPAYLGRLTTARPRGAPGRPTGTVPDWSQLVDPAISDVFLGALMTSVFRRETWLAVMSEDDLQGSFASSLNTIYPHCVAFARSLPGHPAYYIGEPCVLSFQGRQEWLDFSPVIYAIWLHELLDMYAANGVPSRQIKKCRKALLRTSGLAAWRLKVWKRLPGRQVFSLSGYVRRYWRYWEMWVGLMPLRAAVAALGRRLSRVP